MNLHIAVFDYCRCNLFKRECFGMVHISKVDKIENSIDKGDKYNGNN